MFTAIVILALAATVSAAPTARSLTSDYRSRIFHTEVNKGMCLTSNLEHNTLELQLCGSSGLQSFSTDYNTSGQLYMSNPATTGRKMCVVAPTNPSKGAKVSFKPCQGATDNVWDVQANSIRLAGTEWCVEVPRTESLGTAVVLGECADTKNQNWSW